MIVFEVFMLVGVAVIVSGLAWVYSIDTNKEHQVRLNRFNKHRTGNPYE